MIKEKEKMTARIFFNPDRISARKYRELVSILNSGCTESDVDDIVYAEISRNNAYIQRNEVNGDERAQIKTAFESFMVQHSGHKYHIVLDFGDCVDDIGIAEKMECE